MEKKGELTLFIILGIVLVIVLALLFYARVKVVPATKLTTYEIDSVKDYVEGCLKQTLKQASEDSYISNTVEDIADYESLITDYIEEKHGFSSGLNSCINNFAAFRDTGLTIKGSDEELKVEIEVLVSETGALKTHKAIAYYPVTIRKGLGVYSFDTIHAEYDLP